MERIPKPVIAIEVGSGTAAVQVRGVEYERLTTPTTVSIKGPRVWVAGPIVNSLLLNAQAVMESG
jgi:hypothetical protein